MTKKLIHTLVVDDHHLFRNGIVALLNNSPASNVIGDAADGHSALNLLQNNTVDIVILDLEMPGMNGLETCKQIKKLHPAVSILILSWHSNTAQVGLLLEAGARGFLAKDCTKEELLTAISAMASGGSYFSHPITEIVLGLKAKNSNVAIQGEAKQSLTEREQEVLECIANEYTNKEIAGKLFISQRTVETHRRNLIQKLKVKNTVGLVKYYFQSIAFRTETLRTNT